MPAKMGDEAEVPPTNDKLVAAAAIPLAQVLAVLLGAFSGVQKM
jgi:hypothetical protein